MNFKLKHIGTLFLYTVFIFGLLGCERSRVAKVLEDFMTETIEIPMTLVGVRGDSTFYDCSVIRLHDLC